MKGFCIEYRLKGEGQLSESAGVTLGGGDLPARFLTIEEGEARAELEPPTVRLLASLAVDLPLRHGKRFRLGIHSGLPFLLAR